MNLWLLTIGGSDILLTDGNCWNNWHLTVKRSYYNLPFKARKVDDALYQIEPRVLGVAYERFAEDIWSNLEFPLLKNFSGYLADKGITKIICILTDQQNIFGETDRKKYLCPYWKDSTTLQPILSRYFENAFPGIPYEYLKLSPTTDESGLDDWDYTLDLVRGKLALVPDEYKNIYVSHQASTPAISSAVQFVSLAKFRNKVKFLVSNEYTNQAKKIDGSLYLRSLQIGEAKALLNRYDYSGVDVILENAGLPEVNLIKAANLWNLAQIKDFSEMILQSPNPEISSAAKKLQDAETWWLSAYEVAYLSIIRFEQENISEAMFHSFRALEGLAKEFYKKNNGGDSKEKYGRPLFDWLRENESLKCKGNRAPQALQTLQTLIIPYKKGDSAMYKDLLGIRNELFHNLQGFTKERLDKAWKVENTKNNWQENLICCLNLISGQSFSTLKEASIMPTIHAEIETALNQLLTSNPPPPNEHP
jgi:hypothetical protein